MTPDTVLNMLHALIHVILKSAITGHEQPGTEKSQVTCPDAHNSCPPGVYSLQVSQTLNMKADPHFMLFKNLFISVSITHHIQELSRVLRIL